MIEEFKLTKEEKKIWDDMIKQYRKDRIRSPESYIKSYITNNNIDIDTVKSDVSGFIVQMREAMWDEYLKEEALFKQEIISDLIRERKIPRNLLLDRIRKENITAATEDEMSDKLVNVISDFSGQIMPYLYTLNLSTTQSRRARAGSTFEKIISFIMTEIYKYPYEDQKKLGTKFYDENNVSKIVDGIIPGSDNYKQNRGRCLVVTMKTTLKERWQEVVEEQSRTNMPQVHLLTLDEDITESVLDTMAQHNIFLVDTDNIKEKFSKKDNITSYNDFFNQEIPHVLSYWNKRK